MADLKVWANDVVDWVIAASPEDCNQVCSEHTGQLLAEVLESEYVWRALPLDRVIPLHMDDGRGTVEKTCAEWTAEQGRSFLGSTEY